ncbi:Mitochondrial 2-oxoadipate and 2-oxoglutarate transporter [Datura stramonium]|uniref:Mitochondrial 2-oxoadipate and 2-oxoglutarate transporter n=1 Tax=Datura stramonium TaxID=4076 RepID=A0ABS8V817_DATST|nr:Mitochondrial 2-oxoadipate and 2-oxoglutarate transporter [Datura stramonium]
MTGQTVIVSGLNSEAILQSTIGGPPPATAVENGHTKKVVSFKRCSSGFHVKCNTEPSFLSMLSAMGFNFDCASNAEIEYVLSLGISPDPIVFANPCKLESNIIFTAKVGVNLMTFDSEEEVYKIRKHHLKCELLLRIKPMDDSSARCPMRPKYNALPEEVEPLLRTAQAAG